MVEQPTGRLRWFATTGRNGLGGERVLQQEWRIAKSVRVGPAVCLASFMGGRGMATEIFYEWRDVPTEYENNETESR